jgi:hypothetical protein
MEKEIRIFDTTNAVLKVKGIRFELYDVGSGTVLDTQNSDDLNPTSGGSNEWGVKLNFSPSVGPLEIYTSDPSHRSGNTIRRLTDKMITASTLTFPKFRQRQGGKAHRCLQRLPPR